jgi:predicted aspartyl protease
MSAIPAPAHVIPFRLRAGHVILTARVNGTPGRFVLDTGSSVSALDAEWAAPLSLPSAGAPIPALGTGDATVTLATAQSIGIGGLELRDQMVALVPLAAAAVSSGQPIHGTIGRSLFMRYTTAIDYARQTLRLFEPATFVYSGGGVSVPLDLSRGIPLVSATIVPRDATPFSARLVLDIGTSGVAVLFTTPFADAHAETFERTDSIDMGSAWGVGGAMTARVVRIDRLDIGALSFHEPLLSLPRNGAGFFAVTWADGTIGTPIYERTTLILDYARGRAIFEPGADINAPFAYDAGGVELVAIPPRLDSIRVSAVVAGSPASDAGLQVGDVVVSVDGRAATGEALDEIRQSLRVVGAARAFVVMRDGRELRMTAVLRKRI